ncbi:MAG: hypothetical protein R3F05_02060 [Planctomycetota bacterium]
MSPPAKPSTAGATKTAELERARLDYLRWSCDQLASYLRGQWERKARLEAKVGAIVAVLNVFAGFVLIPRAGPATNEVLGGAILATRVGALFALTAVLICWFAAVRVGGVENLNSRAFTDDDGTTADTDFRHRYQRVRDNLVDAIESSMPLIERRATWIRRCEAAAAGAYFLLFVLVLLEFWK